MQTKKKGGRPATGSLKWTGHGWAAYITMLDRSRPLVPLDPKIREDDRAGAEMAAKIASDWYRANPTTREQIQETVEEWAKRWIRYRTEQGIASVKENERRLRLHILPELGGLDMRKVSRDQLEVLVEKLDARKTGSGEYDWRTAVHIWGDVRKMFSDAAKKRALRVRDDNPAQNVEPPRRGVTKAKQYLYPSEALALLECPKVPRLWRRLFAVSTYLYCRPEELEALDWKDVDLEHATVHIHRAIDRVRNKGKVKETKTGTARRVPIHPELLPLLEAMHERVDGAGRVFPTMPAPSALARRLRRFLKLAGVDRDDLHTTDATRRQITWYHATRSTGITWEIVAGTDPMKVMGRAGHTDFKTTLIYVREAENLSAGFGEPFPPLPAALYDGLGGFDPVSCGSEPPTFPQPKTSRSVWAQQELNL